MVEVRFYDNVDDRLFKFAVIIAKSASITENVELVDKRVQYVRIETKK